MSPLFGFTLGAGIDLSVILQAGFQGILLSIFTIMAGCLVTLFFDKWFAKRPGYAGLASCATGANAVAVPAAVELSIILFNLMFQRQLPRLQQ